MKEENNFPDFWYESNAVWGMVRSIEDLKEKYEAQIDKNYGIFKTLDEFLDKSKQNTSGILDFGTRWEHKGSLTLRQYLKENNIEFKG